MSRSPRMFAHAASWMALLLVATACAGDMTAPRSDEIENVEDVKNADSAPESDDQPVEDVVIDPASMPAPGVILAEIDGHSFAFPLDAGVLGADCELAPGRVELRFQAENASLDAEFGDLGEQGGTPGEFVGRASVGPASLDHAQGEGYSATSRSPRIAIEPPFVVIEADFVYRENHTDIEVDEVGPGRITATCP